jgi:hypothetical protein
VGDHRGVVASDRDLLGRCRLFADAVVDAMTLERIAELRALAEAATPGPWTYDAVAGGTQDISADAALDAQHYRSGALARVKARVQVQKDSSCEPNAAFIAAARTALPEALLEIERLRATIEWVRRACSFDASAYLDTEWSGGDGKGMPVVPVADILAALEGKK